jgi:hypothetical protein
MQQIGKIPIWAIRLLPDDKIAFPDKPGHDFRL